MVTLQNIEIFADKGYDSKKNRKWCDHYNVKDRIARRKSKVGKRSNAKRVIIEHSYSWLDKYRRLIQRYDASIKIYEAFTFVALGNMLASRFMTKNQIL